MAVVCPGFNTLLISPKSYDDRFDQKTRPYQFFPYSVVYLTNYLKRNHICAVDYLDLCVEDREDLYRRITTESFDLIGITSTTAARFQNFDLIRMIRRLAPQARIVVGGQFFSSTATEALQHLPEIDFVVRGEGEITLAELVEALAHGGPLDAIHGLSYRENGVIIENPPRKPEMDLTRFEVDYSLIAKPEYSMLVPMRNWEDDPCKAAFPIMLGRGCNNHCIFCIHRYLPYRVIKTDAALRQIRWAMEALGTRHFMFTDPSFCERKAFVWEFCDRLISENLRIEWYCEGRADIPLDLLAHMRKAGCISIDFALESASSRVLKALRKNTDPAAITAFAQACTQLGIKASYFTMISLPEERVEDAEQTLEAIAQLSTLGLQTSVAHLQIHPGTPLEALAREQGVLAEDFSWYDETFHCDLPSISPRDGSIPHYFQHLNAAEVCILQRQAYRLQSMGTQIHALVDNMNALASATKRLMDQVGLAPTV